jgi:transcription-repair coupling factor (superfamily II helicase)
MLFDKIYRNKFFDKILETGESLVVERLWELPKAILAAWAVSKKNVLIVTASPDRLFENLQTFIPEKVVEIPAWDQLPGEKPNFDLIGKRFDALKELGREKKVLLCSLQSLLQRVLPKGEMARQMKTWGKGTRISFATLTEELAQLGYRKVPVVSDKGEFAIRGGILDLFPVSSFDPFRIEFAGDEIDEIRTFDPVSQKSVGKAKELQLSPAEELPLLQQAARLCSLLDYVDDALIIWDDFVEMENSYVMLQKMANMPFTDSFESIVKRGHQMMFCAPSALEELSSTRRVGERRVAFEVCDLSFEAHRWLPPFQRPIDFFCPESNDASLLEVLPQELTVPIVCVCLNETEEGEVKRRFAERDIQGDVQFVRGVLSSGGVLYDQPLVLLSNAEITGHQRIRRQKWRGATHAPAGMEFIQFVPGELVVHFHSGIGKYLGIEKHMNHLGIATEFLVIQYAQESKLFVPMSQSYLVSRYIGSSEELPSLSQLGSKRWLNTRTHAQQQILGYAKELLELYARRSVEGGVRFPADSELMHRFERDFPYTETTDQLAAIAAIKDDMMSDKPMDRLISGDVGYGKTEVAMRAAFKAVVDGKKQVAVLVPTTVLAMQHYETFSQRMSGFSVRIEVASRFRTQRQNREAMQRLRTGEIDIIIGTHRLLSHDVKFCDFGLLIIDEEQRFGVKAKEHLKKLRAGVDTLTLSATPIPRTLYLSLVHARDMSVISTPPQDRLPVRTIIAEPEMELIQNALLRELMRGGQAFFIHNRIETLAERATAIQTLVPTARIGIVHGQMDAEDLDPVFHQFKSGSIDILFSTTIVENGIDIPNANTILIDRADTYGLADLYQLRGRVGRWNRAAYAYFLVPKHARMSPMAQKRLSAMAEASGFGGGMKIAMRDLEIRGAGDILGLQQSGQVSAIGFHLYCKMLKRAIDAMKNKSAISLHETKMEFSYDARIPDTYIEESSLRMEFYYRFGEASHLSELEELMEELRDRFGDPPDSLLWLYHLSRIRVFARAQQVTLLKFQNDTLFMERQLAKQVEQKTVVLPRVKTAADLEKVVLEHLNGYGVFATRGEAR